MSTVKIYEGAKGGKFYITKSGAKKYLKAGETAPAMYKTKEGVIEHRFYNKYLKKHGLKLSNSAFTRLKRVAKRDWDKTHPNVQEYTKFLLTRAVRRIVIGNKKLPKSKQVKVIMPRHI